MSEANYVRADEIEPGDWVYGYLVIESRAYLPNPDVMWMIRTDSSPLDQSLNSRLGFVQRDRLVLRSSRRLVIQEDFGWASISRSTTSSSQT